MPPEQKDPAYLLDMLRAAEKIQRYVHERTFEDFRHNDLLRDGVERNIEIIGEAARRVSEPFKRDHPDIPWRQMIAQRNVLAHDYDAIGDEEIWEVATVHVPRLIQTLVKLMPPIPPDPEQPE